MAIAITVDAACDRAGDNFGLAVVARRIGDELGDQQRPIHHHPTHDVSSPVRKAPVTRLLPRSSGKSGRQAIGAARLSSAPAPTSAPRAPRRAPGRPPSPPPASSTPHPHPLCL